ncbi:MAG: Nif3-like dinuclear metal center hexameric protein [Chitinophagaceae bacterium]|nr:Nif3-like dinuclear metal center hexameric protein [Chitinophagaceae bacterium]
MKIEAIISVLEKIAPPVLQEQYDNAGLLIGSAHWECTGVLCTLDTIESVIDEAIAKKCNLIVAHHPIIFKGLKKINGKNYVERTIIAALKNDIAIYAIHTNLDNVIEGVNGRIAKTLGLQNTHVLLPKDQVLKKLYTFVPIAHAENVKNALFAAGAGSIGNYTECSFAVEGTGTFTAGENTNPFVGKQGERHKEQEIKVEVIFPAYIQAALVQALVSSHPYEEVAYDIVSLDNTHAGIGSGLVGEFEEAMPEKEFLAILKKQFKLELIRHTALSGKPIKTVAICGGAGSFLISNSLAAKCDAYVTADLKYHEFFDPEGRLLLCDIGHFESEQYTVDLLAEVLQQKFPTFAVLKSDQKTNPVYYYF